MTHKAHGTLGIHSCLYPDDAPIQRQRDRKRDEGPDRRNGSGANAGIVPKRSCGFGRGSFERPQKNNTGTKWQVFCAALCHFCAVEFSTTLRHRPRKSSNSLKIMYFSLYGLGRAWHKQKSPPMAG
jgi:hypothetical protein